MSQKKVYWVAGNVNLTPGTPTELPHVMDGELTGKTFGKASIEVTPVPGTPRYVGETFDNPSDAYDALAKQLRAAARKCSSAAKIAEDQAKMMRKEAIGGNVG